MGAILLGHMMTIWPSFICRNQFSNRSSWLPRISIRFCILLRTNVCRRFASESLSNKLPRTCRSSYSFWKGGIILCLIWFLSSSLWQEKQKEIGRKLVVNLTPWCSKPQYLLALFRETFSPAENLYIHKKYLVKIHWATYDVAVIIYSILAIVNLRVSIKIM